MPRTIKEIFPPFDLVIPVAVPVIPPVILAKIQELFQLTQ